MPTDNLSIARRYIAAVEKGASGDTLAEFFTPDVVQEEFPNRLVANGARRKLADILAAALRGKGAMQSQRFEIKSEVASGERIGLEVEWTGTLAVPIGSLPVGGQMRARFAVFLDFRDGKIAGQRNYDCFDPW